MVYRPPYPWYIDPLNHGISTPYPWYIDPPIHGIWTPYPWYFDPLPMEYRPPYLWYIKPSLMYYELLSFGRNEGGSIYHEGVQNTMTKN